MKRTKPTQPGHPCPDYIHSLPKKLADTLHSKSKDRYTKYDAFHYLMERQAVHTSDQSKNHTRPFTVTITELSVDWGWHRHTSGPRACPESSRGMKARKRAGKRPFRGFPIFAGDHLGKMVFLWQRACPFATNEGRWVT